jgi:uncharacterized protein YqjF (DUF2071 family)
MAMSWRDLLFAHWPVSPEALRPLVPAALELDVRDGAAWVGVVPFRMTGVRLRGTPAFPGPGAFPELNVRTYVVHGGRPGVWFFSLDAASMFAVAAARRWFHLPYYYAAMRCDLSGDEIVYRSRRAHRGATHAHFVARYAPTGAPFHAKSGSLEHWLTERYCLYAATHDGVVLRGDVHHPPWPLQHATARIDVETMAAATGVELPKTPPHLLFARRLDVVGWSPERVSAPAPPLRPPRGP